MVMEGKFQEGRGGGGRINREAAETERDIPGGPLSTLISGPLTKPRWRLLCHVKDSCTTWNHRQLPSSPEIRLLDPNSQSWKWKGWDTTVALSLPLVYLKQPVAPDSPCPGRCQGCPRVASFH